MKKRWLGLALALIMLMSFCAFAACDKDKPDNEAAKSAATAFKGLHLTEKYEKPLYTLESTFNHLGVKYNITWSVEDAYKDIVKFSEPDDAGKITVKATKGENAVTYTFTATLTDDKGASATTNFRGTVPADENFDGKYGKGYNLYMTQSNLGAYEWAVNKIDDYNNILTELVRENASHYYLEDVADSELKKVFCVIDGVKNYISFEKDGSYTDAVFVTDTDKAQSWDVSGEYLKANFDSVDWFLGNDATWYSISAQKWSSLRYKFGARLVAEDAEPVDLNATVSASAVNDCTVKIVDPAPVDGVVTAKVGTTISFNISDIPEGKTISSIKVKTYKSSLDSENLAGSAIGGVYTAVIKANSEIVVELTSPDAPAEKLAVSGAVDTATTISPTQKTYVFADAGITITNDKSSSSSDCVNKNRFYAKSSLKFEGVQITKVVLELEASYCSGLDSAKITGASVKRSLTTVVIAFETPVNEFTIESLGAQIRVSNIAIYVVDAQ